MSLVYEGIHILRDPEGSIGHARVPTILDGLCEGKVRFIEEDIRYAKEDIDAIYDNFGQNLEGFKVDL